MNPCPRSELVEAVLERTLEAAKADPVRAHVAGCDRCLARFGASFELELWGERLAGAQPAAAARPARRIPIRIAGVAAAAAALVAMATLLVRERGDDRAAVAPAVQREVPAAASASRLFVFELVTTIGSRGPDGERVTRTVHDASEPAVVRVAEERVDRTGFVQRHESVLPLAAVAR